MNVQKCWVCGKLTKNPVYRKVYPYKNFPSHNDDHWEICKQNLMQENFQPLYHDFKTVIETADLPQNEDYSDLIYLFSQPDSQLDFLLQVEQLQTFIQTSFPETEIQKPSLPVPAGTTLSIDIFRKLVAYELQFSPEQPLLLYHTTQELFYQLQTGQMPWTHLYYYHPLPPSRSSRTIFVPEKLLDAMQAPWIRQDKTLDRLLLTFSQNIHVRPDLDHLAFQILRNKVSPQDAKKRLEKMRKTKIVNFVRTPLTDDVQHKTRVLEMAVEQIQNQDQTGLIERARNVEKRHLSSCRVSDRTHHKLKEIAQMWNVSLYQAATVLLESYSRND